MAGVPQAYTDSGIEVRPFYTSDDVAGGPAALEARSGRPGQPPFTRGPYPSMYRGQLWTMRQFAGYGSSDQTNERMKFLLRQGQTALSVAFDLPTQLGYDSDHELARPEVGRVGVAIDTNNDVDRLFEGLPLDQVSVNFTINATAPIILAMYLVAAERQGVAYKRPHRDAAKRHSEGVPGPQAFRLPSRPVDAAGGRRRRVLGPKLAQVQPHFNYRVPRPGGRLRRRPGARLDDGRRHCVLRRTGRPGARFRRLRAPARRSTSPPLSTCSRRWPSCERPGASGTRLPPSGSGRRAPASARLRFFSGNSGATLTAQQPFNNIVRSTIQCLGAVLGGAQSVHVMGYDEAYELPSEEAVTLSLRTQQIVAYESGVTRTADPLAGSYYVEWLTDELERQAREVMGDVERAGGAVAALEAGLPQRWIAESAYRMEKEIASGSRPKVGLNVYAEAAGKEELRLFHLDPRVGDRQVKRLSEHRADRNGDEVGERLAALAR